MQLTCAHGRRAWRSYRLARRVLVKPRHASRICPGFPDVGESVYFSANMRKFCSLSTSFACAVAQAGASKKLVFGHGFRPAEGPVGRNGALPGPSCAHDTVFSCPKHVRRYAAMCGERIETLLHHSPGVSICVTSAGRFTYEEGRVEYHRPLVNQAPRFSPCVCDRASCTRLALAYVATWRQSCEHQGGYGCSSPNRAEPNRTDAR